MSLLEQDTTSKKQVDENNVAKLDANNNEGSKYQIKAIWDSAVYSEESANHLPGLYYLVF